jgi:hypothetical protein
MKEQRLYKRFSTKLPVRLDAITGSQLKAFNLITKDISATGAFIYIKETSFIPDDAKFILNYSNPKQKRMRLKKLKQLKNCTGTLVRATAEGLAIRFDRPIELFV